jgi:hypothetical protein
MDPRDGLHSFAGGVDCAACGRPVPLERIRILARREDISFVEIDCPSCRSESLGIVIAGVTDLESSGGRPAYGEFLPTDDERFHEALPIGSDDVHRVRELLTAGDLSVLVGRVDPPAGGPGR